MKRILLILSLALGALALTGCTTESDAGGGVKVERRYFGG